MGIYFSSPMSDDERWQKVLSRGEVLGDCSACGKKKVYALRTIYGDNSETLRCLSCNAVNQFTIRSEDYYDNGVRWKPLGADEIEDHIDGYNRNWEQANKNGKRRR